MNHHPFGRVECEGVCEIDSGHPVAELGADECCAGVGGVHVQPQLLLLADRSQLLKVVEGAGSRGAESSAQLPRRAITKKIRFFFNYFSPAFSGDFGNAVPSVLIKIV